MPLPSLVCVLGHYNCVRLFVVLCTIAHQSPLRDFSGKNAKVGCHALLQGIFPIQGLNPGLLHCRQILYQPSNEVRPYLALGANDSMGFPGGSAVKNLLAKQEL